MDESELRRVSRAAPTAYDDLDDRAAYSGRTGRACPPTVRPKLADARHGCSVALPEHQRHRAWCDLCLPTAQTERGLSTVGRARQRKRPPRTDYGRKQDYRRAESMAAVRAAEHEWEREHRGMARPLPSEFASVREALSDVPLQRIHGGRRSLEDCRVEDPLREARTARTALGNAVCLGVKAP